jgi:heptosyltransferase-3
MNAITLERHMRNAVAACVGRIFPIRKYSLDALRADWQQGRIRKVLLIRVNQGMGDLLLATPMIRALKTARPETKVHLVVASYKTVAVRDNPRLDRVWSWNKKKAYNPFYLWTCIRAWRAEKYDLAILISSHTPSLTSFLLARAAGVQCVIGFDTLPHYGGANWSRGLCHTVLPNPSTQSPEWVKYMDLVRPLGVDGPYELEFTVPPSDRKNAAEQWKRYAFPSDRPVVGLYLGGNPDRPERLWPAASWAELAHLLSRDSSVLAVLPRSGLVSRHAQREEGVYEDVSRRLGRSLPVFRDTHLSQGMAFLSLLNLFVCPDGGLMHAAIASRVPTLGLCLVTDPECWVAPVPWATGLRSSDSLPSGLSPQTVFETISRLRVPMKEAVR